MELEMATKRKNKTLEQLREMIEAEVRKYPDYVEVTPSRPYIHEPDEDGCNWDLTNWNGPAELVVLCKATITPAVRQMRAAYLATE
jgi:hypothetical protein